MVCAVSYSGSNRTLIPASFAVVSNMILGFWLFIFRSIGIGIQRPQLRYRKKRIGSLLRLLVRQLRWRKYLVLFPLFCRRARIGCGIRVALDHRPGAFDFLGRDIGSGVDPIGFLKFGESLGNLAGIPEFLAVLDVHFAGLKAHAANFQLVTYVGRIQFGRLLGELERMVEVPSRFLGAGVIPELVALPIARQQRARGHEKDTGQQDGR